LVTTHAAFFVRSRLFLLTEYLPDARLDHQIKARPLPLEIALRYAVGLCRAITHARKVLPGFVHGDIKPGNCFVTADGALKLGDFGLASAVGLGKHAVEDKKSAKPRTPGADTSGGWGGTAAYMAPEMFDKANPQRTAADVYAFGITLFEMLAGYRPFTGSSKRSVAALHRDEDPNLGKLAEMGVPLEIVSLIQGCLAKQPSGRPTSFEEIECLLQRFLLDHCEMAVPAGTVSEPAGSEAVLRALSFSVLGKHEEAAACVDSAMNDRGRSAELLACKAIALSRRAQHNDACEASLAAVELHPGLFLALFARALSLSSKGDLGAAEDYLLRSLRLEPHNCSALNFAGDLFTRLRRYDEASRYLEISAARDGSQAEPWEALARINLLTGRTKKAISCASRALSIDGRLADSNRILGDAYLAQNKRVEAINFYKAAMSLPPFPREPVRSFIRAGCGLWAGAGRVVDFQFLRLLLEGSTLLRDAGKGKLTCANFVKKFLVVFRESGFHPLLIFLTDSALIKAADSLNANLRNGLYEGLRVVLESKDDKEKLPAHVLYSLGRVLYSVERYDECMSVMETMLRNHGPSESTFYYLAACSEVRQDFAGSLEYYKKALRLADREDTRTGIQRVSARLKEFKVAGRNRANLSDQVSADR
jgi:tetratricopeptide (TPR) repeat protein